LNTVTGERWPQEANSPSGLKVMHDFRRLIESYGVTPTTVDESSMAGGDHPESGSKWKRYYRSLDFPQCGVLIAYADPPRTLDDQQRRLNDEARNYQLLQQAGHDCPLAGDEAFLVDDRISGKAAVGLVVEHCDGPGPFKARIQHRAIMKVANGFSPERRQLAKISWNNLRSKIPLRIPSDLQIMFASDGRIMIVDPEQTAVGLDFTLPDWNERLRVEPS
jgi:hypothetical protein